jgi:type IV secretion system protein VirD4
VAETDHEGRRLKGIVMYRFCRALFMVATVELLGAISIGLLAGGPWVWAATMVAVFAQMARRGRRLLGAHGTARWANDRDLKEMIDADHGLILGRLADSQWRPWRSGLSALFDRKVEANIACWRFLAAGFSFRRRSPIVRLSSAVHTAIFAPTGVGKGVSIAVPFLLTCPDSCVVVDLKGELAHLTAKHRRKTFGHRVILLDPFQVVTQRPDTFDPLNFLDPESPMALDECRDLAEALVIRTGQEKEPHWNDSAEVWIAAMIAATVQFAHPENRSLQRVRELLSDPAKIEAAIKIMCESGAWDGMLARLGHQLTHFKDKELASTLTTSNRFLRFLDTLAIADSTKSSSFDPADLCKGRTTVYLVLPPEHMRAQAGLLRMWIGSMLRACVRGGFEARNKVHFVLDEAASLGHMEALDDAVDKYRGAGVRLQFYYQSLGQLKKCWPDGADQTLLSNTSQIYFGVNDLATAEHVSGRLGEETIVVESGGTSKGTSSQTSRNGTETSSGRSRNWNENWQQQAHKLLKPDEVMALSPRTAITFTPGCRRPIWTTLLRYYEEKGLARPRSRFVDGVKTLACSLLAVLSGAVMVLFVSVLAGSFSDVKSNAGVLRGTEEHGWEGNQEFHPRGNGRAAASGEARIPRNLSGALEWQRVYALRTGRIHEGRAGRGHDDGRRAGREWWRTW